MAESINLPEPDVGAEAINLNVEEGVALQAKRVEEARDGPRSRRSRPQPKKSWTWSSTLTISSVKPCFFVQILSERV